MSSDLPGLVLRILIIAVPLALLVSVALLSLYRRAVVRAMRSRGHTETAEALPLESSWALDDSAQTPLDIIVVDSASTIQKN
jgi:hypothetical protein